MAETTFVVLILYLLCSLAEIVVRVHSVKESVPVLFLEKSETFLT
jgi:hypothetical protein